MSVYPYFNFLPEIFDIIRIRRYSNGDHPYSCRILPIPSELDLNENVISLYIYSTDIGKLFREPTLRHPPRLT
jgi:hypothetical protein